MRELGEVAIEVSEERRQLWAERVAYIEDEIRQGHTNKKIRSRIEVARLGRALALPLDYNDHT